MKRSVGNVECPSVKIAPSGQCASCAGGSSFMATALIAWATVSAASGRTYLVQSERRDPAHRRQDKKDHHIVRVPRCTDSGDRGGVEASGPSRRLPGVRSIFRRWACAQSSPRNTSSGDCVKWGENRSERDYGSIEPFPIWSEQLERGAVFP